MAIVAPMMRNRVRTAGLLVTALLMASVAGCGGDPAPKSDPSSQGSPTGSAGIPSDSTGSPFSSDAPLADGPWIPSASYKFKVPKGFKGDSEFGVVTLRRGPWAITSYDPSGLGDSTLQSAIATEKKLNFTGKTEVETGTATVDGQDVQTFVMTGKYEFFRRIAYGVGVDDTDGQTRFVVIGFEGESDPTAHQDTIDSVLSSIRWNQKVVG